MAGWLRQGDLDGKATGGFLWSYLSLEGGTQPMADVRIALRDLLRKYRDDTEVDALKEGLVLLVQELRGGGGEGEDRGRAVRANEEPANVPQRVPRKTVGHPGGHGDAPDPQGSARELLPGVA